MTKKLKKSNNKVFCGVCGGLAEYIGLDPTVMRLIVCVLSFVWGAGLIIYIVAALIMPPADTEDLNNDDIDNLKSANVNGEEGSKAGKSKASSKATEKSGSDVPHSDEDFDAYFKK